MDQKTIQNIRKDYARAELTESHVKDDPMEQFSLWFHEALHADLPEPTAMNIATATKLGQPSSRMVLLKGVDHGFVFYTNYQSRKGNQLEENPQAALTFFWPELERQVRVEGRVEKVSEQESDEYFHSRPFKSRIGAHASPQSQKIAKREILHNITQELLKSFGGLHVPRPPHWGGYRVLPHYIEFWQGRPSRLHDRIAYELIENRWVKYRLAP
ncbi:pyridoxamine 5'-phosphate oxidase [bacterium]|nr:pyridoxamine 5'-phosphate oxidase [bacterium]